MVNLCNETGSFHLEEETWLGLLEAARQAGWEPLGTVPPLYREGDGGELEDWGDHPWAGAYFPALGQEVVGEDAAQLADHLQPLRRADLTPNRTTPVVLIEALLVDLCQFLREGACTIA